MLGDKRETEEKEGKTSKKIVTGNRNKDLSKSDDTKMVEMTADNARNHRWKYLPQSTHGYICIMTLLYMCVLRGNGVFSSALVSPTQ